MRRLCIRPSLHRVEETCGPPRHVFVRTYLRPRTAPSVRRKQRTGSPDSGPGLLSGGSYVHPWPLSSIEAAFNSGNLPVTPKVAVSLLDNLAALKRNETLSKDNVAILLQERQLHPYVLTVFAKLILLARNPSLALGLLSVASALEDEHASMLLVEEGLKHGKPQHLRQVKLQAPLKHLEALAVTGNLDALVLSARVKELHGDTNEALSIFREVVKPTPGKKNHEKTYGASLSQAWEHIARLERKAGNDAEALEALKVAALQYGNPSALYELAQEKETKVAGDSLKRLEAAAISGLGDAAFELGKAQCLDIEDDGEQESALSSTTEHKNESDDSRQYSIIKEWFLIAVESGNCKWPAQARLHAARVMRKLGEAEKSLEWLNVALQQLQLSPALESTLQNHWSSKSFGLTGKALDRVLDRHSKAK